MGFQLLLCVGLAAEAGGESLRLSKLHTRETLLQAQVMPSPGREAARVSLLLGVREEQRTEAHTLTLFSWRKGTWLERGRWALPQGVQHHELLPSPAERPRWLLYRQGGWWFASAVQGKPLVWQILCACAAPQGTLESPPETLFQLPQPLQESVAGAEAEEPGLRLGLPLQDGLWGFLLRQPPQGAPWLEALWSIPWNGQDQPPYKARFEDADGDGRLEWLFPLKNQLGLARLPHAQDPGGQAYVYRAQTAKETTAPVAWRGRSFSSAADAREALETHSEPEPADPEPADWRAQWPLLLARHRDPPLPQVQLHFVKLPELPPLPEDAREHILALRDTNGDGVLDLLHARVLERKRIFRRRHLLRWYPGRVREGKLSFAPAAYRLETDAGSIATVISLSKEDRPPWALLVARTEVSLGSVVSALIGGKATLKVGVYPWHGALPASEALFQQEFLFTGLLEDGRRPMFLSIDLDGDGRRGYVLNPDPERLLAFPTHKEGTLSLEGVSLPARERRTWIGDLDQDGREELLFWYQDAAHAERSFTLGVISLR